MKRISLGALILLLHTAVHAQFNEGTKLISAGFSGSVNSNKNEATANMLNETFNTNNGLNLTLGKFYKEGKARGLVFNYMNSTNKFKSGLIGTLTEREQTSQNHYGSLGYFQNKYVSLGKQFYGIVGFIVAYRLDYSQTKTTYPYNSDPLTNPANTSSESFTHNLIGSANMGIGYLFHPKMAVQSQVNVLSLGAGMRSSPSVKQLSGSYTMLNNFSINAISFGFAFFL